MLPKDVLTVEPQFSSLSPCDLSATSKAQIRQYFLNSYGLNETLFTALTDESVFYKCPDRLRLPLIFYYGHTAAVYINKLVLSGLLKKRIDIHYESLFETGVDEMSWDDVENYRMGGSYDWPPLKSVLEYRREVKDAILRLIDETALILPVTFDSLWWSLFMGMEHERIHFETSSVLIRQLPIAMVARPLSWRYGPATSGKHSKLQNELVSVSASEVEIGKPIDFPSYGWDNEYGQWNTRVPAFEASKYKITNGEFLPFVLGGGYNQPQFWTTEGWKWKTFRQSEHPVFWVCEQGCKSGCGADLATYSHCSPSQLAANEDGKTGHDLPATNTNFRFRLMFDVVDLPVDWPVEVNYHEAKAYCAWLGTSYRLPTEAENHLMRGCQLPPSVGTASDLIYAKEMPFNLNLQYGSSTPVDLYPPSSTGFYDAFGNVWEWCEDQFNGLPGGRTSYLYDDFSSPCYDGQHNMILGGSWVSTGDEASRFARYAFRRHFFQHCGFRIVRSLVNVGGCYSEDRMAGEGVKIPVRLVSTEVFTRGFGPIENPITLPEDTTALWVRSANIQYELDTEEALQAFTSLEYGVADVVCLPVQTARLLTSTILSDPIVDGCSSGSLDGLRLLHIGAGVGRGTLELMKGGFSRIIGIETSGRLLDEAMRRFESIEYKGDVIFKQFTWIPNEVGHFDVILFSSVDRMSNVRAWISRFHEVVRSHGIVVLVSSDSTYNRQYLEDIMPPRLRLEKEMSIVWSSGVSKRMHRAGVSMWRCRPS